MLCAPVTAFAQVPPEIVPLERVELSDADEMDVNLGAPEADERRVAELVTQLGDPEFEKREQASTELTELCPGAFGPLARAYAAKDDFETRLRIEEIVRSAYLWHTLLKRNGFLGVQFETKVENGPEKLALVLIRFVERGSAADEAGLRPGDEIRLVDGAPVTDDNGNRPFRNLIQSKGAGAAVRVEVIRRNVTVSVDVTLQARPINQYQTPDLLDQLNSRMQMFAMWWGRHFRLPEPRAERTPSTAVLEVPD